MTSLARGKVPVAASRPATASLRVITRSAEDSDRSVSLLTQLV